MKWKSLQSEILVAPHVFGLTRELALRRMSWTALFSSTSRQRVDFPLAREGFSRRPPRWN